MCGEKPTYHIFPPHETRRKVVTGRRRVGKAGVVQDVHCQLNVVHRLPRRTGQARPTSPPRRRSRKLQQTLVDRRVADAPTTLGRQQDERVALRADGRHGVFFDHEAVLRGVERRGRRGRRQVCHLDAGREMS